MDKPSIQMDDLEERDVRRTAAGLIRMLFGILLFILAVYVACQCFSDQKIRRAI